MMPRGFGANFVLELALNLIYLRSKTVLPIYVFFAAVTAAPGNNELICGAIAIVGFYLAAGIATYLKSSRFSSGSAL